MVGKARQKFLVLLAQLTPVSFEISGLTPFLFRVLGFELTPVLFRVSGLTGLGMAGEADVLCPPGTAHTYVSEGFRVLGLSVFELTPVILCSRVLTHFYFCSKARECAESDVRHVPWFRGHAHQVFSCNPAGPYVLLQFGPTPRWSCLVENLPFAKDVSAAAGEPAAAAACVNPVVLWGRRISCSAVCAHCACVWDEKPDTCHEKGNL